MADALEQTGLARADTWPEARRRVALDRYCREIIARCDLIDLHGLPLQERDLQNQKPPAAEPVLPAPGLGV